MDYLSQLSLTVTYGHSTVMLLALRSLALRALHQYPSFFYVFH